MGSKGELKVHLTQQHCTWDGLGLPYLLTHSKYRKVAGQQLSFYRLQPLKHLKLFPL